MHHDTETEGSRPIVETLFKSPEVSARVVDSLLESDDYLVLVDADFRILEANDAFRWAICRDAAPGGLSFTETLASTSRGQLASIASGSLSASLSASGTRIELFHSVSGGTRAVRYWVGRCGELWLLSGRDESAEIEIVSQMSVLGEELSGDTSSSPTGSATAASTSAGASLLERAALDAVLEERLAALAAGGEPLSLVALDIDSFRQVNDLFGHPTGDLVIEKVSQVLEENLREQDSVAKVGGEEYVVLLCGLAQREALDVAERLRTAVELAKMPDQVRRITISLGVASLRSGVAISGSDAIALAEKALLRAKDSGRNCVRSIE